jgi:hypothetical protein
MNLVKVAMLLSAVGTVLCLWLLVKVTWYNFLVFMLVAQPLLLLGAVCYVIVALRELRRTGAP